MTRPPESGLLRSPAPSSRARGEDVHLRVSARLVARVMTLAVALFIGMHGLLLFVRTTFDLRSYTLDHLFDVLREANVPTWYSSVSLMACALLLILVSNCPSSRRRGLTWQWLTLAALFAYASLDEAATIHERVQAFLRASVLRGSTLYSMLSVAFTLGLAIVGALVAWRVMWSVPARTTGLFIAAGVLFVGGAVGFDLLGEFHKNAHGEASLGYSVYNGLEEALEMSGVLVFVYALLDHLRAEVGVLKIEFTR